MQRTLQILMTVWLLALSTSEAQAYRRRARTPYSASLHGMANVIRAKGQAARSYSRARINNEEARSRYIDNQLKWTQTYFAKKEINAAYVAQESAKRQESVQRYLANQRPQAPPRLSLSQFDSTTGEIFWPDGLLVASFQTHRGRIEELFQLRATAQAAPGIVTEIRNAVEALRNALREQIELMAPTEYLSARKFLDSLAYEGTLPSR